MTEFVNEVKSEIADYGKSLTEVGKLRLAGMVSRVLGLFLLLLAVLLCIVGVFTFAAIAAIAAMSLYMPVWAASLIVVGVYVLLLFVLLAFRKPLFVHPFIALMTGKAKTERDLDMQILDAKHNAELQRVRIEGQVETATRELDFYTRLVQRIWNYFTGEKKEEKQDK